MEFAVLTAKFSRAGPPFSGALTVRGACHSQVPGTASNQSSADLRPHRAPPSNERPGPGPQLVLRKLPQSRNPFSLTSNPFSAPQHSGAMAQPDKMAPLAPPIVPGLSTVIVRVDSPRHSTPGTARKSPRCSSRSSRSSTASTPTLYSRTCYLRVS